MPIRSMESLRRKYIITERLLLSSLSFCDRGLFSFYPIWIVYLNMNNMGIFLFFRRDGLRD